MAVNKSVAAPASAETSLVGLVSIPATASTVGELKTTEPVTALQTEGGSTTPSTTVDAVAQTRTNNLAKARAAKAAKAQTKQTISESPTPSPVAVFQAAIAADSAADRYSFGEIKEVARIVPTAEEYVKVEIPLADLFDHSHPGVQLNRHKFEPGKTYLLRGDVALEVKKRLAMFHDEQVRLLRPNADRKALADVNRGSQWTSRSNVVPLGRLEDV